MGFVFRACLFAHRDVKHRLVKFFSQLLDLINSLDVRRSTSSSGLEFSKVKKFPFRRKDLR